MKIFFSVLIGSFLLVSGFATAEVAHDTETLRAQYETLTRAEKISLLRELRTRYQSDTKKTPALEINASSSATTSTSLKPSKQNPRLALFERIKANRTKKLESISVNESLLAAKSTKENQEKKSFIPPIIKTEAETVSTDNKHVPEIKKYNQLVKKSDYQVTETDLPTTLNTEISNPKAESQADWQPEQGEEILDQSPIAPKQRQPTIQRKNLSSVERSRNIQKALQISKYRP